MTIKHECQNLLAACDKYLADEADAKAYAKKLDNFWEQCRLRAITTNPQTYADKGQPL